MSLYSVILMIPCAMPVYVCLYIEILVVNTEESWTIVEAVAAHFYGLWCNYYDKWHYTLNWITARAQKHTSHTKHSVSGWVLNFAPAKSTLPNIPVESPLFFFFQEKIPFIFQRAIHLSNGWKHPKTIFKDITLKICVQDHVV